MSRPTPSLSDRLVEARETLRISQAELARRLRVTPEWMSRVINGHHPGSVDLELRLADLLVRERSARATAVAEEGPSDAPLTQHGEREHVVALRKPAGGEPSTRADVESYFKHYLDRADGSGNPNAFPAIQARLDKQFPLDEWDDYEARDLGG